MNFFWIRAVVVLLVLGIACAIVGLFANLQAALITAVSLLVLGNFLTLHRTQRLWRLLDSPIHSEAPSAPGIWGEIHYRLHKLAKRWHAQVQQIEQQHNRFIQAIQASPNGVVMLDDNDQIEWCNAICEQHFGLDAKRDLRQHITHLVRRPEFIRYLHSQHYDEVLVMHGMGETRQNVLSVEMFPYGENHKLVLTHDITELERTDAMRRDFVANVSHELKTPLTVLAGFFETMRELPLSKEEHTRYLALMEQQAARMRHIIEDLLVLAKLEGDSRPTNEHLINMNAVLRHLREDAAGLSANRHRIHFEVDDGLTLRGIETEILCAFGNLVSNAIRYTPDGGAIHVIWQEVDGCAVFAVTDNGLGVPASEVPRLTERFYRVDRSRSRDTGGTGLGLAIVKHVLQRHDTVLDIKSEEGRGSTFSARFPTSRAARYVATASQ